MMAFKLATGKLAESPFCKEALDRLRKRWAALLPAPSGALQKAEGQPFLLDLMAQTLKIQGDPDFEILVASKDSFATGVPVGYEEPIPPAPAVSAPGRNRATWMLLSTWKRHVTISLQLKIKKALRTNLGRTRLRA